MEKETNDQYDIYAFKGFERVTKKLKDHRDEFCINPNCANEDYPIIKCQYCLVRLHEWKLEDHLTICLENRVPCLNSMYGCPAFMTRRQMFSHLPHCPANIVFCKSLWSRGPIEERKIQNGFKDYHVRFSQLDVALAVRDDHLLRQSCNLSPSYIELCFWNGSIRNTPNNSESYSNSGNTSPRQTEGGDERSYAGWNRKKYPPGLKSSIIQNLLSTNDRRNAEKEVNVTFNTEEESNCEEIKLRDIVKVDLQIECPYICPSLCSVDNLFLCNKRFRRDEIHSHYEDVHNQVQSNINGWYQTRCPLAYAGCNWHAYRFAPDSYSQMEFDFELDAFVPSARNPTQMEGERPAIIDIHKHKTRGATPEIFTSCDYNSNITANDLSTPVRDRCRSLTPKETMASEDSTQSQLLNLPIELIIIIMGYLDPASLWKLSSTCRLLHILCESVVKKRGIIDLTWEKDKAGWKVAKKTWHFTTAFSKVNWTSLDRPKVIEHLKSCKFYQKNIRTERVLVMTLP